MSLAHFPAWKTYSSFKKSYIYRTKVAKMRILPYSKTQNTFFYKYQTDFFVVKINILTYLVRVQFVFLFCTFLEVRIVFMDYTMVKDNIFFLFFRFFAPGFLYIFRFVMRLGRLV